MTTYSRGTDAARTAPSVSCAAPSPYPSAVSTSVPPASTNAVSWAVAVSRSVASPHVIVPSPMRETSSPLLPTRRRRTGGAYGEVDHPPQYGRST